MTNENENTLAIGSKINEMLNFVIKNLTEVSNTLKQRGLDEHLNDKMTLCKAKLDVAVDLAHIEIVNQNLKEIKLQSDK